MPEFIQAPQTPWQEGEDEEKSGMVGWVAASVWSLYYK